MNELSKRDFEALGCEDVPGPKLRMRVFQLEGLVAELAQILGEMISDLDINGVVSSMIMDSARDTIRTVKARYDDRTSVSMIFHPEQVNFLKTIGVRIEQHTSGSQCVYNDRADFAETKVRHFKNVLSELINES